MRKLVIFGASGDLTRRKLIPALYNLWLKHKLNIHIIGMSRTNFTTLQWINYLKEGQDFEAWAVFTKNLSYVSGNVLNDPIPESDIYYLAVNSDLYGPIAKRLNTSSNVIIEKPFGTDLETAKSLNHELHLQFNENQLYRVDHYLGKIPVQNLLVFRFANTIFEPIWTRDFIDHIQITVAEPEGIGTRANYYDQNGVLRDMFQNHLLQLLALIAMEAPSSLDDIRDEKLKLLRAISTPTNHQLRDALQGQYEGYRQEFNVSNDSMTPTFGCAKVFVNNWRWTGVPFYLRSGKALAEQTTRIVIQFKQVPHSIFQNAAPNKLVIKIQPEESIRLHFTAKLPGQNEVGDKTLLFQYQDTFPDAYQTLLLDAFNGNKSLFTSEAEIEEGWRIVDPLQRHFVNADLYTYAKGSWGPPAADELLIKDGRMWL